MKIKISLNVGPLQAEFTGEEREELEENLLDFIGFLEENEETFGGAGLSIEERNGEENSNIEANYQIDRESPDVTPDEAGAESGISFGSIPNRTEIDSETLNRYFGVDPEGEEPPYLNFDLEVLEEVGDSRSEKQMRGSLMLLTLWRECQDVEEVQSPQLKDALRISGIDDDALYNMYGFNDDEGDRYFSREGSGANTIITLTMPGEREGYDQIQRTIERLEAEAEEGS